MEFTKDPSTHPANGPLTEERLIRVRDELASLLEYAEGSNRDRMIADAVKALIELLALRKAGQEPIYQLRDMDWYDADKQTYDTVVSAGGTGRIVYAAPQLPQPAVVQEVTADDCPAFIKYDVTDVAEAWARGYNARSAAMLQGAEPVSQPYTLPDGWVAVPVEPTEDMIIHGFESEPDESFSEEKDWWAYEAMSGCQQAAHRAKLCWAAMIAAAPQQE